MVEMQVVFASVLAGLVLLGGTARAADAPLPKRDLTVELRQTEEGREEAGHYSAGGDSSATWEPQMVQVRNGEKALLRLNDAIPMQWTQSVSGQAPSSGNGAAAGNAGTAASGTGTSSNASVNVNAASGVHNALVWMDTGQSLSVQPKWPGGNHPAVVEIEVQRAAIDPNTGTPLPKQTRNTVSTTITAPLAEWVTIAATGKAPRPGVYSSEAGLQVRRLLQIRVIAP
jgi:hypothetical protein